MSIREWLAKRLLSVDVENELAYAKMRHDQAFWDLNLQHREEIAQYQAVQKNIEQESRKIHNLARERMAEAETAKYRTSNLEQQLLDTKGQLIDTKGQLLSANGKLAELQKKFNENIKLHVSKLNVKAGDVICFRHDGPPEMWESLHDFGFGIAAVASLQRQLSEVAGGPVFVMASQHPLVIDKVNDLVDDSPGPLMESFHYDRVEPPEDGLAMKVAKTIVMSIGLVAAGSAVATIWGAYAGFILLPTAAVVKLTTGRNILKVEIGPP